MKNFRNSSQYLIKSNNRQSGLSLIELMIAMFIGLFLLFGITTSYLTSKKSSIDRDQISILQDNGRVALEIMTGILQHTGYTSTTGGVLDKKFINVAADVENTTCNVSSVVDTTIFPANITQDGINTNPDSIGVTFLGDNSVATDCLGGVLPATCLVGSGAPTNSARIYNAFFIDSSSNLRCAGSRSNAATFANPIAENVENMQILYGIDNNADSVVDSYINATAVDAAAAPNGVWSEVISIQLAILIRSDEAVKTIAEAETFSLLDTAFTVPTPDKFQRAVFSTTISLRNSIN